MFTIPALMSLTPKLRRTLMAWLTLMRAAS